MKLQTPVADERCRIGISYTSKITMLGSCFSDNIGTILNDYGFDVLINPFGTIYNPVSIMQSIEMLLSDRLFTEDDCVMMGAGADMICSFSHHTSFARRNKQEFLSNANCALTAARKHFLDSDKIIITLGTSWCFRNIESGRIVSNCLKRPAAEFERERLHAREITEILCRIIDLCNPSEDCRKKEFIFTVSPIRHFKDGAHGNQISKAGLLLGIDDIICTERGKDIDYFPAYEIMMDELRDYRFYAEDMCHPSQQAIDYLGERFLAWALPKEETSLLEEKIRNYRKNRHQQKLHQ